MISRDHFGSSNRHKKKTLQRSTPTLLYNAVYLPVLGTSRWKSSPSRVNDVEYRVEFEFFVQRLESSQFAPQTRVRSSQVTYRLESSLV